MSAISSRKRRGSPTITPRQRGMFLEKLTQTANVTASAQASGFDRRTAYDMRSVDPDFAAAWDDALEQSIDTLEAEARRRAMDGVQEPVVSMGRIVEVIDDAGNKAPLYVRKYSDTLMITLLKAHRGHRFNPTPAQANVATLPPELMKDPEPQPDEPVPEGGVIES